MISAPNVELSALSVAAARRIDAACDRWEEDLRAGRPSRWEDSLESVEVHEQPALLRQLLLLEWEYRHERGEALDLAEYVARFPGHATLIQQASEEYTIDSGATVFAPAALSAAAQREWEASGYQILSPLGRGGMGTVYLACQRAADRLVALKVLHPSSGCDAVGLDRFRREARALAQMQHPQIVQVFEVGEHQGRPFYSMEYCPGGSLAEHLRQSRLAPREAAALVESLAKAVHAAHQAGIIHRDLKPSNVLLSLECGDSSPLSDIGSENPQAATSRRTPKLADFGLAKRVDATAQTLTGAVLGTPQYMAPEQARGDSKGVGVAADIHGLGGILFECLTGRPPFLGASPLDTMLQVVTQEATPPTRYRPDVPRDLETICLKCLHKEPRRRYANAAALAEDLRRFREGEPILARTSSATERAWHWIKRYPAAAALLGVLVLGSVLSLGLAAWALGERDQAAAAQRNADEHRRRAERGTALAMYEQALSVDDYEGALGVLLRLARSLEQAVEADAPELEKSIRRQLGHWSRDARHFRSVLAGHTDDVFAVAFSRDGSMVLTGSADQTAQLWNAATGERLGLPLKHLDTVFAVAFSSDAKLLLTGSADGTAQLWDAATGERRHALQHKHRVLAVAFSPDDQYVLTGGDDKTAQLWDTATGEPLRTFEHPEIVRSVAFSSDGRKILTGCDDKTARIWETATAKLVGPLFQHKGKVFAASFSPDAARVLTGSADRTAQLWNAATGEPIGPPMEHLDTVFAVAFSPDGQTLLTGCDDKTARLWEAESGILLGRLPHRDRVRAAAFSPDGRSVLTGSWEHVGRLWDVALPRLINHRGVIAAIAVSPDGKTVLTGSHDNLARLWDAATGQALGELVHEGVVRAVAFSPDGKTILTGSHDNTGQLWKAATGKPLGPPLQHNGEVRNVAFSPDGKLALTGSLDASARLWRTATGEPVGPPLGHKTAVSAVAFSPDGTRVLTASWDRVHLWDAATGKAVGSLLEHRSPVTGVAFSPDGRTILSGSEDHSTRLWDAVTLQLVSAPLWHRGTVTSLAFSPDGKTVLTGSEDKMARLWETATSRRLGLPLEHQGTVAVAFSPDGKTAFSGSWDGSVRRLEVLPRMEGHPKRILLWSQVIAGMELDEHGQLRALDAATWSKRNQELRQLGGVSFQRE